MITSISNSELTAQIKHLGAELCSLKNNSDVEYIWEGNPDFWGKHSPILFPIVGTLKNNSFTYNQKEYTLSRHGFARDMEFELIEKLNNKAIFSLKSSEDTLKLYPSEFELQIIYTLEAKKLIIDYKVENKSKVTMPFSIGAHPAFSLTGDFENYSIEFEKEETLDYFLLENDLVSNTTQKLKTERKQIALNYELFANDALIFKTIESKSLVILKKSNPILKVRFEDFPNLGIWTKIDATFICIEPWFGYSDTIEKSGNLFEKEGIQIIAKDGIFKSSFYIEIF
ncbi:MAG: aldose 1-epimerase family protein [Flavobacterium sp.]|nr:aldose 1-epimerase family protein [Flavobacterium sp.]